MTERDFVFWLLGYLESAGDGISKEQAKEIKNNLRNVQVMALNNQIQTIGYVEDVLRVSPK